MLIMNSVIICLHEVIHVACIHILYSGMDKPTRSDSYPNSIRLSSTQQDSVRLSKHSVSLKGFG